MNEYKIGDKYTLTSNDPGGINESYFDTTPVRVEIVALDSRFGFGHFEDPNNIVVRVKCITEGDDFGVEQNVNASLLIA